MTTSKPSAEVRAALFEQLADRLRQAGAIYPVAATVALVARGDAGIDQVEFAKRAGCTIEVVQAIERGDAPFEATLEILAAVLPDDIDTLLAP